MTPRWRAFGLAAVIIIASAATAFAQTAAPATPPQDKDKDKDKPPAEPPPPPYEPQLLRLSEIMGSLAYLRGLCGAPFVASESQDRC